jgi:NadR type nicotinamide-nucleotide adenylyltransferase
VAACLSTIKMNSPLKKIVALGPESTGKSTLCSQLADHYHTIWCPEFAREYLITHGMNYTYSDLLTIAKEQVALEEKLITALTKSTNHSRKTGVSAPTSLIFIDTDLYVMKVWCEFVFGKCHSWILKQLAERQYDLYLLCNTDIPWVKDELREYPDLATRKKLFFIYKDHMMNQSVPWVEISGNDEQRLKQAITAVDRLLAG